MDFIQTTLASAAVTTALFGALIWIGRAWIKERLSRSIKHEYDLDLEKYKSELTSSNSKSLEKLKIAINTEYEIIKSAVLRYSERQFELYNDLWASLCDLETCVETLWEDASVKNLRNLANQMQDARKKVKKSALLIEDRHYRELNFVLDQFDGFRFGKQHLIEIRNLKRGNDIDEIEIRNTINQNATTKDHLMQLLSDMMRCLKSQIVNANRPNPALHSDG